MRPDEGDGQAASVRARRTRPRTNGVVGVVTPRNPPSPICVCTGSRPLLISLFEDTDARTFQWIVVVTRSTTGNDATNATPEHPPDARRTTAVTAARLAIVRRGYRSFPKMRIPDQGLLPVEGQFGATPLTRFGWPRNSHAATAEVRRRGNVAQHSTCTDCRGRSFQFTSALRAQTTPGTIEQ